MTDVKKDLEKVLLNMKNDYENAIRTNGREGQSSLIKSSRFILQIHEFVKKQLKNFGIDEKKIFPRIGERSPEIKLTGILKQKNQDVVILPKTKKGKFVIEEGIETGEIEDHPKDIIEKSLVINVRSQMSSQAKNFDTLLERQFAEAMNLHRRYNKLVMGEVYLVPLYEYDDKLMKKNQIDWKDKTYAQKMIKPFQYINGRKKDSDYFKYERNCLLIVDFSQDQPQIISDSKTLIDKGIIDVSDAEKYSLKQLNIDTFFEDLLKVYETRHGSLDALK